ncbi:MAG: DNA-processing protein DprA [Acidimicrobiales bacterium]
MGACPDDDEVAAALLAGLPGIGPARLARLLEGPPPGAVLASLVERRPIVGHEPGLVQRWRDALDRVDPGDIREALEAGPYRVAWRGAQRYPRRLHGDPEPPGVLFFAGRELGEGPRVAIVGTRRCTRYGLDVARELGRSLSVAGVSVVSGLARGIDAAAHAGSLDVGGTAPVAVVGSGVDTVYPTSNRELWARVASAGTIVSESPLGATPKRWRFPARNRLIAGLADAVVVVESRERGGSMSTVEAALRRGVDVFAVPGPVRSAASAGTNRLIADGAAPLCDVGDVLLAIGLDPVRHASLAASSRAPAGDEKAVLDAVGWAPVTVDMVARAAQIDLEDAAVIVERLVVTGRLTRTGQWIEQVAGP